MDVLLQAPEVIDWILQKILERYPSSSSSAFTPPLASSSTSSSSPPYRPAHRPVCLGTYVYLDGTNFLRVSAAVDSILEKV